MKEIKKTLHLQDVSDQQTLDVEKLSKVIGGAGAYGCIQDVCSSNYNDESKVNCTVESCLSATCTSGVNPPTCTFSYDWEQSSSWPPSEGPQ